MKNTATDAKAKKKPATKAAAKIVEKIEPKVEVVVESKPAIPEPKMEQAPIQPAKENKPLSQLKYSISINPSVAMPRMPEPAKSEPEPEPEPEVEYIPAQKPTASKTKKADLRGLVEQIKQHPEVLKLIDRATLQHKKFSEYKYAHLVQDFRKILAKTLKILDNSINYIVHKDSPNDHTRNEVVQQARPAILFGIWVSIITFLVFGVWAALAPLNSSSAASGTVIVDSVKKTIQHKEGGIVEAIYVKDGDHVKKGQELIKLSPIDLQASISSAEAQITSLNKQLKLIEEQVINYKSLFEKGLLAKQNLIQEQLREAGVAADLARQQANIIALKEQLGRLVISSPIDGIVNQLNIHTVGGVIRQGGESLMNIIPQDENLVIEAYVQPQDIDSVHVGLKAKVRITAFRSRSTSPLDGVVTHVSPDVIEIQGRLPAFKVRVEIDQAQLSKISRLRTYELYPGMTAEVNIVTGERTFLQYLLDPITSTFWHAFNEK